jgi:molybdopterin-guanine dinucleotide biosynthesis protein B
MPNIISIVGKSNSGKTTLIEKIIPILSEKGYKVATIKHDAHSFEIDREGKDTYRHKKAGAKAVIISSSEKVALIKDVYKEANLDDLIMLLPDDIDIVLTEGYKRSNMPKIEVYRTANSKEFLCKNDNTLVAVVTDNLNDSELINVNNKFYIDDANAVANFIEDRYIQQNNKNILLYVDGQKIALNDFVKETIISTITGLLKPLKSCDKARNIHIKVCQ